MNIDRFTRAELRDRLAGFIKASGWDAHPVLTNYDLPVNIGASGIRSQNVSAMMLLIGDEHFEVIVRRIGG